MPLSQYILYKNLQGIFCVHSGRKLQLVSITRHEFFSEHEVVKGEKFNPSLSTHLIDSKSLKMTSYICMCVCVCV